MTSRARQTFETHSTAIRNRDLDAIVSTYAFDAVLADTNRIGRGHDYIRAVHEATLDAAADMEPTLEVSEEGDVVFVSWRATPAEGPELVGTNTFVITDGLIAVNTAFMTAGGPAARPRETRLDQVGA